ncbi:protein kinase domain-containing protein [Candidatus Uabimicrobium amorphum]|uniref:non-specific serine/threonine protein kinase n=1 Tax=Uabimicrobium amorphum TaxID=2596890 RepID=A0A5S9F699_UABAM|nr:serine/threonine-protein kinase [Candidatus Uabimicrobium amorphum]BBM87458.1 protein kinase [Candidatus Uabimicrobium amorphum]
MSKNHKENDSTILSLVHLKPGQMFAHYRVYHELGQGGMGTVYKAYDTRLQRIIALKILHNDSSSQEIKSSLLKETQILASLNHDNIVKVLDVGVSPLYYFTMEYIEGSTLEYLIDNDCITIQQSLQVLAAIANAIHHAHKENILHRDIKPGNIMLTESKVPKLMDFGIAKIIEEDKMQTQNRGICGTPAYCSPEQLKGKQDKASDIYSLGVVLYECLTGNRPFSAHSHMELMLKIDSNNFIPPRHHNNLISREVEAICLKCLRKSRKARYSSAKALERDLRNYLEGKPIIAKPAGYGTRLYKYMARNKLLCLILLAMLLLSSSWIYIIQQKINHHQQRLRYTEKIEAEKKQLQKVTNIIFNALNYMTKEHANVFADPIFSSQMVEVFKQDLNVELNHDRLISVRGIILANSDDTKDLEQALQDFNLYLEKNPRSADRYNSRGMVYRKLKRYKEAIADYNTAINITPRFVYFFNRGVTYEVLGKSEKAIQDYTNAINVNPNYFMGYASRALAYEKQQKYSFAIRDYERALRLKIPKGLGRKTKQQVYQRVQELKQKIK